MLQVLDSGAGSMCFRKAQSAAHVRDGNVSFHQLVECSLQVIARIR